LGLSVITVCDTPVIAVFDTPVITVFETQVFGARALAFNDRPYLICGHVTDLLAPSVGPGDFDIASPLVAQTEMDNSAAGAVYAASSIDSSVLLVVSSGQCNLGSDGI
jgi:hypothetical protein